MITYWQEFYHSSCLYISGHALLVVSYDNTVPCILKSPGNFPPQIQGPGNS